MSDRLPESAEAHRAVETAPLYRGGSNADHLGSPLFRSATLLTADLDRDRLLQRITDEATALCHAEFGAFFYNIVGAQGESYMLYTPERV